MPALHAEPQVHPGGAVAQALLAAVGGIRLRVVVDRLDVLAADVGWLG